MSYKKTAIENLNEFREQADRLIATHIMGWEVRAVDVTQPGDFQEAYFDGDEQLEYVDTFEFYPSECIKDAFWVLDTVSVARDIRFVIDTNAKRETEVSARSADNTDYGIYGSGASAPMAITKAVLGIISKDNSSNDLLVRTISKLTTDLQVAEAATLEFAEPSGSGLKVDLDKYLFL